MSVALENIPASEGVRKVAPGEGERSGLGNEDPMSQTLPQCARRRAHRDREVPLA
jgi:hypothetical protein